MIDNELFRGKRRHTGEWVYGSLFVWGSGECDIYRQDLESEMNAYDVIPETVGGYTGLKDKKDTRIYSGDIAKDDYGNIGIVEWSEDGARFQWYSNGKCYSMFKGEARFEVIGNIHDNPESIPKTA
jgi:uncharacterized phage protein (TIGR01671 family)